MTTERDEWKPRYNNDGQNDDGQNRERRPYQSFNRSNYGNNQNGNYGRQDNRGSYNRPNVNYDRQRSNYDRPASSGNYNSMGNYDRSEEYGGYNHQGRNNYDRMNNGYNSRPQRNYGNQTNESAMENGMLKRRRPRVGEVNDRQDNAYNRNNAYQQKPLQRGKNKQQLAPRNQGQNKNPNAKYSLQKQLKYREEHFDPNEPIRLNKYLANAGICSRREADAFIQSGVVKVNGEIITELGTKVKRADQVTFHDQPVKLEHKIYVLLNKPKNCVTTADDPQERLTVMDLVKNACQERIFPVGRLDRNTTGVLLLTNDGDLASKLTHPKFLKKKIYHVWLDKNVSVEDMQKMVDGVELEDGEIHADAISYVTDTDKDQVGIEIHSGRNRIVRRMFENLGYSVVKLDRVYFAGLTKKNLKRGHWRYLNEKEVSMLRMGAFE
ncbi:MAG: rRNA pseudouridine synthase [Dysgonamonadaceae bacterium]|jgi:23S rRNA pseudouridine2605 synthase|nr:rRNA pseudouridine synthase [Dysgonamonadaceae bacterium]